MSPTVLPTTRRPQGLQGRHVLSLFLGFFGVVLAVNGAMVYSAVSTHTGLVANEPYRKGLHYNARIAADERQTRLGWVETLEVSRKGRVSLTLTEVNGIGVGRLEVAGVLGRPSTNRYDIKLDLSEVGPARYAADAGALEPGSWLLALEARRPGDVEPVYRSRRRLWLEP